MSASLLPPAVKPPTEIPGTENCGCCEGVDASTPILVDNRIGLSAVAYRIGEYAQFRESLVAGLSSVRFDALTPLLTRDADDFTIGLLDAFACSADVLTFYQERIANESWLRTATERVSLQEMARLIGYRMRPGVAAETSLAFALETPPVAPATLAPEPGAFVTGVPTAVTLETGLKVQSVPGPDEKPQVFETVEAIQAKPEWGAMRPWLEEERRPGFGDKSTWLAGVRNDLKAGDALLFLGDEFLADSDADNDNWDFRLLDHVETDAGNDRTYVSWRRGLGSLQPWSNPAQQPQVFALRRRAAIFGHNAPQPYLIGQDGDEWPAAEFTISTKPATAIGGYVDLDAVYSTVSGGGFAVLARGEFNRPDENFPVGTYVELYKVVSTIEVSRADFALSAKVTRLQVTGENLDDKFFDKVRETTAFVQSEPLAFRAYPVTADVAGAMVPVAVPPQGLEAGRRLIVRGTRADNGAALVHEATLVAAHPQGAHARLEITPPLPAALVRASVVVHANVARATHGESVSQLLGSGDAGRSFQRFSLQHAPLTYRAAGNETGADSELEVRVDAVEWSERATLYDAVRGERVYTVRSDEQGKTWVQFGDGERGARLPSGQTNVRARYRKGLGVAGNLPEERLTQPMSRPLGLKSVSNPLAAEGGTDPESADEARTSIPLGTRTLSRAVSLLDYEDFARAFSGIAKAQAQVLSLLGGRTVAITVAGPQGTVLSSTHPARQNLLAALKASGDPHVPVVLLGHQASPFHIGLKIKRDPAYERDALLAAVEAALRAHFGFDRRALGQPVLQSEVIAVAHAVPGVVAVDLDLLYGGTSPFVQTLPSRQLRLLANRMRVSAGQALPAELLTLHPGPLARLEEMP